jgi:hypothetical protein
MVVFQLPLSSNAEMDHTQLLKEVIQRAQEGKVINSEAALGFSRDQIKSIYEKDPTFMKNKDIEHTPVLEANNLEFLFFDKEGNTGHKVNSIASKDERLSTLTVQEVIDAFAKQGEWRMYREIPFSPRFDYFIGYECTNGTTLSFMFEKDLISYLVANKEGSEQLKRR